MNLESAPRLPKLPFFIGDAVLLVIAGILAMLSPRPLDGFTVIIVAVLVVLGAALLVTPFILDYAANTADAATRERERLNDQATRLHAATESLARAAAQIKAVEEAVHKAAREAETLPYRMQEKLAEFNETLAAKEDTDREALERELEELRAAHGEKLQAAAEKVAKATTELVALEKAARQQFTAAETALAKLQAAGAAAASQLDEAMTRASQRLDAKLGEIREAVAQLHISPPLPAAPSAAPAASVASSAAPAKSAATAAQPDPTVEAPPAPAQVEERPAPASKPVELAFAPEAATEPAETSPVSHFDAAAATEALPQSEAAPAEPAKPKKPRAPRKPKPEESLLAASDDATATVAVAESVPQESAAPAEAASVPSAETASFHAEPEPSIESDEAEAPAASRAESSSSSDGATRLLATAYIGIGNKLFIRGDGPGLSWDKGVPMQFVSIGKWGWSTHEAVGPINCKLYKNDETAALTGDITLESGRHTEVTALF